MKPSSKKGFSLIELIFVIAVLGIIAAVAVPKLMDTRSSAIVSTVKQDISTITSAIQSYYMMNNKIDDISDAVNINTKTWTVTKTAAIFSSDGNECVKIEVATNQVQVTLPNKVDGICKKIHDSGVVDVTYELY